MPAFSFTALNTDGKELKGELDAVDMPDARRQLRERSLMPLALELGGSVAQGEGGFRSPARYLWTRARDKQFFFRQLALMIQSGHRVRRALDSSAGLVEREGLARSIRRMVDSIDRGLSFSDAVKAEGRRFPAFVPALIQAGERSGTLSQVLDEIAVSLERAADLRNTLLRAMIMPSITLVAALLVLAGIIFGLVPILADFISRQGGDLHWTMQILVDITDFMLDYGTWIAGTIAGATFAALAVYTSDHGKVIMDRIMLSVPIFGQTMRLAEMSRFGGIGTLLVQSGLRPVETLKVLSDVTQNHAYRKRYLEAADSVLTGQKVSTALGGGIVPKLVVHMIAISELTGSLDVVLARIGTFYQNEVTTRISVTLNTLVPAVTIIVGVIVGVIYLSLLLTILGAYNSVR